MTRKEISEKLQDFVHEYYRSGKYLPDMLRRRQGEENEDYIQRLRSLKKSGSIPGHLTKEEMIDYRKRLIAFFENNVIPEDLRLGFTRTTVGESFVMINGYGILSNEGLE